MTVHPVAASLDDGAEWTTVSTKRPCPVCGSNSACLVHGERAFACCAKNPSEWPLTTGAWLHRLHSGLQASEAHTLAAAALSAGVTT